MPMNSKIFEHKRRNYIKFQQHEAAMWWMLFDVIIQIWSWCYICSILKPLHWSRIYPTFAFTHCCQSQSNILILRMAVALFIQHTDIWLWYVQNHTWYLSRAPREYPCKFLLAGVNFYRFNAKNWQFTVYFAIITQKLPCVFCCNLRVLSV